MKMKTKRKRNASSKKGTRRTRVTTHNGTIDIEHGLGRMKSARAIARTLKQAADASGGLKVAPYAAAMAALDHLIAFLDRQKERLEAARIELRKLYGESLDEKPVSGTPGRAKSRRKMPANGTKRRRKGDFISAIPAASNLFAT
jgi:hypothetical protein